MYIEACETPHRPTGTMHNCNPITHHAAVHESAGTLSPWWRAGADVRKQCYNCRAAGPAGMPVDEP
jgi:hypothetical protein